MSSTRLRAIDVRQGDDLRSIAARELGDPTRWADLARINDLRLPFIVASAKAEDRLPHTLIWGDRILVPWVGVLVQRMAPEAGFGIDVRLSAGRMLTEDGDIAVTAGTDNLVQALSHRVQTLRGELVYHPEYGSHVQLALGLPAGPFAALMAASWVYEALRAEPRLAAVDAVDARIDGDTAAVAARVTAVGDNTPTDFNLVLTP